MNGKQIPRRVRRGDMATPLIAIGLSLVVASLILLILGKDPLTALLGFLRGSGLFPKPNYAGGQSMLTDFLSFLGILTPMIFASLGVMVAMKSGLFNIGVAGQMLLSGFFATITVGYSDLPAALARPLVILIAVGVGGLVGGLTGFLRYRFNIHEVVSSIMLNYIVSYVTGFFINTRYVDMISRMSKPIRPAARLLIQTDTSSGKLNWPIGFVLALAAVVVVRFLLQHTTFGFRLKSVGMNPDASRYAGINVGRSTVAAMTFSGILAGLAGATYYLGYFNTIVPKDLAALGYDAIAVSVLGNINPVGTLFASILITIFQKGSVYMSSSVAVPKEMASVITGVLLLFSASGLYFKTTLQAWFSRLRRRGDTMQPPAGAGGSADAGADSSAKEERV